MSLRTNGFIAKDEGLRVLRQVLPQLIEAVRTAPDPDAIAVGTWTVRDVAVHLGDAFKVHQGVAVGEGTAFGNSGEVAANNQRLIELSNERDLGLLADRIEEATKPYLEYLASVEGDPIVPWADLQLPLSAVIAMDIAECLVHGYDIANASGTNRPIDPYAAALAGKGLSPVTMHYVDPDAAAGLNATFDLRLRGQWQLHFVFEDGVLSIEEPSDGPVDVHISADPVTFMLVGYGRISQWGPILKGKMTTWGRKPWLAFKFGKVLRNP